MAQESGFVFGIRQGSGGNIVATDLRPGGGDLPFIAPGDVRATTSSDSRVEGVSGAPVTNLVTMNDQTAPHAPSLLRWTQGGSLPAPAAFTPLAWQPRDPAKAPFELAYDAATFNATVDVRQQFGYNASRAAGAEPFARLGIEEDYEIAPGTHHIEVYFELGNTGAAPTDSRRPIFISYNRAPSAAESCSVDISCGIKTNDAVAIQRDDGAGVVTTFALFPGDITQSIVLGTAGQAFEIDCNVFSVPAGGNASISSAAGFVQVFGNTHLFLDSNADVVVRPNGVTAMADFTTAGFHLHPTPGVPPAPAAGFVLYIDPLSGALTAISSGGTITPLAPL
jgi:hypothetical protein